MNGRTMRIGTIALGRLGKALALVVAIAVASACGSRPGYWDVGTGNVPTHGLSNGVALVDSANGRLVMLTAQGADLRLTARTLPLGHNVTGTALSSDGQTLFVLTAGDFPPRPGANQSPALTAYTVSSDPVRYPMSGPLSNVAIDPEGRYAVAYPGTQTAFVENPNEIVIFSLQGQAGQDNSSKVVSRNIRSYGGSPQRLTFTPQLQLANGIVERLLVIESNFDVTLLDLDDAFSAKPPPEVTVRLTSGTTTAAVNPAGIAVYAGAANPASLARIAIRASNDSNLFTLVLGPPDPGATNAFSPTINLTDVRGIPTDIAFVQTDATTAGGLRVAALVPQITSAVLVEPDTSLTTFVPLPSAYSRLSLVTNLVTGGASGTPAGAAGTSGVDVALLWGAATSTSGVALWTLGMTSGQPFPSVEVADVTRAISVVDEVAKPNDRLRVLESTDGTGFFVLDLAARTAAPLTTMYHATLTLSRDGQRLWAIEPGGTDLAAIRLEDPGYLSPVNLTTDLAIDAVYDVQRTDDPSATGRSLIAIHHTGTIGVTVFDAISPSSTPPRRVGALLLEGP